MSMAQDEYNWWLSWWLGTAEAIDHYRGDAEDPLNEVMILPTAPEFIVETHPEEVARLSCPRCDGEGESYTIKPGGPFRHCDICNVFWYSGVRTEWWKHEEYDDVGD